MLLGYTYDKQLFTSEAFRKFEDTFINGNSGVLSGMEVTVTDTIATISDGWALIKGGLLREQGSSVVNLSSNGYYIVALQINLSETNTELSNRKKELSNTKTELSNTKTELTAKIDKLLVNQKLMYHQISMIQSRDISKSIYHFFADYLGVKYPVDLDCAIDTLSIVEL